MSDTLGEGEVGASDDIAETLRKTLQKLRTANYSPVVIVLNSWVSYASFENSELFKSAGGGSGYGFAGYFDKSPLFNVRYLGHPCILVVDLARCCLSRQFEPWQVLADEEYLADELTFCVRPFTDDYAKETLLRNRKSPLFARKAKRPGGTVAR